METDDLRRHALQARQFSAVVGEATFTLCVPTRLQMQLALLEAAGAGERLDASAKLRYRRLELLRAVVGWAGVRESHIAPTAGAAPLPFAAELVELLLDANPEWEDALSTALLDEQERRAEIRAAAEKN